MKSKKALSSILLTLVLTLCLSGISMAQEITGSIVGTVRDSAGAVVPGATVTVTDPSKSDMVVRTAAANDEGEFSIPNIPIGTYNVTVEAANFKKSVNTGIAVEVGQRRQVEIALEAG